MLLFTARLMTQHLLELKPVTDAFGQPAAYAERALAWLARVEESLHQIRSPLAARIAVERTQILAAATGLSSGPERAASKRRATQAATTAALGRAEECLREQVLELDRRLGEMRDRMANLLATASAATPLPLRAGSQDRWVEDVWRSAGSRPETRALFNYLNASLQASDRRGLLSEILENLCSNDPVLEKAVAR